MTGFDRMLYDKLHWTKIYGNWFALFGVGNLLCYGLSFFMNKKDYLYHFSYTTYPARWFKPFKAMMGSDNWLNVAITAPTMILLNFYLH